MMTLLAASLVLQLAIAGTYTCTGTQPNGEPYVLDLRIEPLEMAHKLTWTEKSGQVVAYGVGLADALRLSAAFWTGSGDVGVAMYTIAPGQLNGVWTDTRGMIYTETCRSGHPV